MSSFGEKKVLCIKTKPSFAAGCVGRDFTFLLIVNFLFSYLFPLQTEQIPFFKFNAENYFGFH